MEKINFKKEGIPFTQVANEVLNSKELSFKAKGIFAYLYSKPDGWNFESRRIAEDSTDGRDGVRSGLQELEDMGYLRRYKTPVGRMVYVLNTKPMTENPSQDPMTEKANDGKSHSGKSRHISNKEIKVIKSISNTPPIVPQRGSDSEEFQTLFQTFWENYPRKVSKATALRSWTKLNPGGELRKKIFSALEEQKKQEQWQRDGGKYIPHPATWLNQSRWEDEVMESSGGGVFIAK